MSFCCSLPMSADAFFFSTAVRAILGQPGDSRVHAPIYRGSERDHPKFPARRVASSESDEFCPHSFQVNFIPFFLQNIHAIGDRANAIVLDVFENALKATNVTALRPRLEHAQIMTRRDMARLGKLGGKSPGPSIFRSCIDQRGNSVIASVQPTHA